MAVRPVKAVRPTKLWRARISDEAARVAAGTLSPAEAYATQLFPKKLLTSTDAVLDRFEAEIVGAGTAADKDVFKAIERVVRALNKINEEHDEAAYETGEREELCAYIEAALADAGVDVPALAARRGVRPAEITDDWREW